MRKISLVLLASVSMLVFIVAVFVPRAIAKEKIIWKHADYIPQSSMVAWGVNWFYDEIQKRAGGRFECKRFWSSALSPAKAQPNALKSGLCQSTSFVAAYYPSKLPLTNILWLPSLFPVKDTEKGRVTLLKIYNEWLQTPLLKEEFAQWNGLATTEVAPQFYSLMGNVRITNLADIKGKKIRAMGGTAELLTKVGAAVVYTTSTEMYDALGKGVIEAATHHWSAFYPYKTYEVSKYWTQDVSLGTIQYNIAVNNYAYKALPQDIKDVFQKVSKELPNVLSSHWARKRSEFMEAFEKAGIEFGEFSKESNEKLQDLAKEIWKEKIDKLEKRGLPGREAFNSLQDIIKKHIPDYDPYHL